MSMGMEEKSEIVIMDFSGIYGQERFHEGKDICWVEVQGLPGSNCYCDDETQKVLRKKVQGFPVRGIHFIDSGNYHYMSRIWLEKIQEPFRLFLFDNHTDMQPPAFGGLLSCGGWAAACFDELPFLREVVLIGPPMEDYLQVESVYRKKVRFLDRENLRCEGKLNGFLQEVPMDLPVYISIDKDILCTDDASTVWSQGEMRLDTLLAGLELLLERMEEEKTPLFGVDICGECDPDSLEGNEKNDRANAAFLKLGFQRLLTGKKKDGESL